MKKTISIIIFFLILSYTLHSSPIRFEKAQEVAINWKNMKAHRDKSEVLDYAIFNDNDTILLYVFNFVEGGFVITSADTKIVPIIAYAYTGYFKYDSIDNDFEPFFKNYKSDIKLLLKNKTKDTKTRAEWENIKNATGSSLKSNAPAITQTDAQTTEQSVAPLLESTKSSRWSYWEPYSTFLPNHDGTRYCVPIAITQVCKYYRYPYTGTGTASNNYNYNGSTYNYFVDFSKELYNYSIMPFRLTYCGNPDGMGNCTDGSFAIIPGITQNQINEVGKLIYHFGTMVNTKFHSGTNSNVAEMGQEMHDHLGYDYNYWNYYDIYHKPGFKDSLRSSLNNKRVIYYDVIPGHAVVIDGYETEYFHMAYGNGGSKDAYDYIFTSDDDGIHPENAGTNGALVNLRPNCNWPSTLNVTGTTSLTDVICHQANSSVVVSNYVINGDVTSGAKVMVVSNNIILNAGFEVKLGASFTVINGSCNY